MSIPLRISTRDDFRKALKSVLGYAFIACVPRNADPGVFDWLARRRISRVQQRIQEGRDDVARNVELVLCEHRAASSMTEVAVDYYLMALEDDWARWRSSRSAETAVTTEVAGLHHLVEAQQRGRGAVLWGTSFCGTLFPKIALSRAGVSLVQLSSYDHGKSHHNTLLGARITDPMYCLPENRFLRERIVIPQGGGRGYLYRIGEVLNGGGCVWIACHGSRSQRNLDVTMLGRPAKLPAGAPTIAMRHNAALIPAHTERLGSFRYRVTLSPPIRLEATANRRETVRQVVQDYADLLGTRLLERPGSWNWSHAPIACGLV